MRAIGLFVLAAVSLSVSGPALAQDPQSDAPPEVFRNLIDCRQLTDDRARLACYDGAAEQLADAHRERKVVIADREQIKEARRGLFGLSLPNFKLFSSGDDDQVDEIESTIRSARTGEGGKWILVLEDGARWAQTDTRPVSARPGDPIRIRRAAMGSFLANVNEGRAIRVKRLAE